MKRVAVLRGGPSEEYDISMQTGSAVLDSLKAQNFDCKDVVVTKKGEWLENGLIRNPESMLDAVDVVFVGLHGKYGEDGQVQKILQRKGIPFTGSRSLPSAIAFNKELTKQTLKSYGIKMPRHRVINKIELDNLDDEISLIFKEIGKELFVKPIASGSSLGARYIPSENLLKESLINLFKTNEKVLVEEFIRGKEATVGVLSNFRDEKLYALPVIEIIPPNGEPIFSHENKYNGTSQEIVPGRFSYEEKSEMAEIASKIHSIIECKHYSRCDFIVKNGQVYFLEINTLPGLTKESLFPKAAAAVGLDFNQLTSHLINTAHV